MNQNKLILIVGPTAAGKTALAIQLAQAYQVEIFSTDARQCFCELNIGVAKPSQEQLQAIKHHFINSHSIHDNMNAKVFETYTLDALRSYFVRKKIAIAVGGSGMYIKALLNGLDDMPSTDKVLREYLNDLYQHEGIAALQALIKQEDLLFFTQGEIQNPHRMIRALEIKRSTGKSILEIKTHPAQQRFFDTYILALDIERSVLYQRIGQRVQNMIQQGLADEVKSLQAYTHLQALQTVGYAEWMNYFLGTSSLKATCERIVFSTQQYAKRQLTWFKKMPNTNWINAEMPIESILEQINQQFINKA